MQIKILHSTEHPNRFDVLFAMGNECETLHAVSEKSVEVLKKEFNGIIDEQKDESKPHPRKCSECRKDMFEGYVIDDGDEYYCNDECLHKHYTPEERQAMYDESEEESGGVGGGTYRTEREKDDLIED